MPMIGMPMGATLALARRVRGVRENYLKTV
jgi:hypothetical protein